MPAPEEQRLIFFVREAWPSVYSDTSLTEGLTTGGRELTITSRMEDGVIFGDGIENDRIDFGWGSRVTLSLSERTLQLML